MSLLACAPVATVTEAHTNAECASCHPTEGEQFASSRHASATTSEVFVAMRARAGEGGAAFCDGCHAHHDATTEHGVGCVSCHAAIGNRGVRNARLELALDGPVRIAPDAHVTNAPHDTAPSDFLASADLCGTCHEVAGAAQFVETTYTEWQGSSAASDGTVCADCHMARTPSGRDHRFVGPDDPHADELLRGAATVTMNVIAHDERTATIDVTVSNTNTAHAFPTGATFARDAWVEIAVYDRDGDERVVAGGAGDPARVTFGDTFTHGGTAALPFEADARASRAIAAGGARTSRFVVAADGAMGARVRVRFRRERDDLRALLGLSPSTAPAITVASADAAF